jgi:3-hydroxyisobutyrate dehydrogenase-like beta-hydroxyacid dehydrogenase
MAADGVGFVGLGEMGAPMASHLVSWPGGLVVCDVRAEARDTLADRGARVARTPADVAREADVISVMVLDDEQVKEVVLGPSGVLAAGRSGLVVALHSTIAPRTAEQMAALCEPRGVDVVDAPVSGGVIGAHEGRLAVLVGGEADAVERCRGPFGMWAELFVHLGPVGAGTRGKLARNLLHFASFTAAAEAQRLAEAAGVDLVDLARVVRHTDGLTGGPGVVMLRDTTEPMAPGDTWYDTMAHVRDLGEKDLALALALGDELGVDLPLARAARRHLADGLGVPHPTPAGHVPHTAAEPA